MSQAIQVIVNGLQIGSVYILFALGLTLIFGVMKVVNFAHGALFGVAAYTAFVIMTHGHARFPGVPVWFLYLLSFVIATLLLGVIGVALYYAFFKRFAGDLISTLIVTIGFALVLEVVVRQTFGSEPLSVPQVFGGRISIAGASVTVERVVIFVVAIAITALVALFVRFTPTGIALRAVTSDREAAQLQGVSVTRIALLGVVIAMTLAAIAGVLIAPATVVTPTLGYEFLMKGFVIIILGGLGSLVGAVYAGFFVGLVESVGTLLFDLTSATILTFCIVVLVLLFRPQGLMGHEEI
ncbi:branched-chain amino acid ABC transporter permease [Aeromicrobium sp. CTD01-1L150]|uniref:branched-chain amino acid ABC transporter permease n=1 Tax=Aeromicrobium sp. CTD01-1L150 TaxID=3341830 RepID=UPI0035C215E1